MRPIDVRLIRSAGRLATVLSVPALVAMLFHVPSTAARSAEQTRTRPARGADNPLVRPGEFAPDFELPRLTLTTDAAGKSVGVISQSDTVRLSLFRGKRPVCMIMSSYT